MIMIFLRKMLIFERNMQKDIGFQKKEMDFLRKFILKKLQYLITLTLFYPCN